MTFIPFLLHISLVYTWNNVVHTLNYILLSVCKNLNAKSLKEGALFIVFTVISGRVANHGGPSLSFPDVGFAAPTPRTSWENWTGLGTLSHQGLCISLFQGVLLPLEFSWI